jgi:PAS domain S-box-containing protein
VHNAAARDWTADEVALVEAVVERCWAHVERVGAQARLSESEAKFHAIANSIDQMVWSTRADGYHDYFNDRWYDFTGVPYGSTDGDGWNGIFHPEDQDRAWATWRHSLQTGEPYHIEYRLRHRSGQYRWVIGRAQCARDEAGRIVRWYGTCTDIHDLKEAESRLRESEERYRTLFESIESGFCVVEVALDDPRTDYRVVEANPAFYRQTGFPEDIIGRWLRDAAPDLEEHWFEIYGRVARTGRSERFEQGSALLGRWFDVYAFRVGEPDERRVAILFTDISARRNAEERLREESRTLETLNTTGAALAAELDLERVVQMVTDAGVALTGAQFGAFFYNVLDDAGESYMLYTLSGVDRSRFEGFPMPRATAIFRPTFDGEGVVRSDDILADPRYGKSEPHFGMPKGHLPVRSYLAVPVTSRSGEVIGGLFFGHPEPGRFDDRHERLMIGLAGQSSIAMDNARLYQDVRRANETLEQRVLERTVELETAHEALRQSQKMEAMGQLTGGVAHDFNNLLTPIVGALDLLQRKGVGGPREQRLIGGAAHSADRAKTLVQRLLAFARRQPLQMVPVDIPQLVAGMADLIGSTTGPQIKVVVNVEGELPPAKADPNQLEMALLNLAVNARDAMPDGGTLRISASADTIAADAVPGLAAGDYVRLSVADTGTGMNEDTLKRAIEPFFSTKGIGRGTGLGLSMVHGLASQLGGALTITSKLGLGTNIELWLPQSREAPADREGPRDAPAAPRRGTVLLVDDEDYVRLSTADMLEDLGYRVIEAASSEEALSLVADGAEFDLLVTDHLMPGMTGSELARRLLQQRAGLPVLVISGYAESEGVAPDLPRLTKPFRAEELAESLAAVMAD